MYESSGKSRPNALVENIYKLAHLNGTCLNDHLDWHKEGLIQWKELKKLGVIK
jgi:hypothetical protein